MMTEATLPSVDDLSQRIAARGRVALVDRLRTAYRDAASTHADIVSLDENRLEALIQNAADHADGLQWRRALAGLVAEELGVSVAEALSHPAVARAQSIVGAPSYEQSLAELITRPIPPPMPAGARAYEDPDAPAPQIDGQLQLEADAAAETSPVTDDSLSDELEEAIADDTVVELLPEPDPSLEAATESYELPVEETPEPAAEEASEPAAEETAEQPAEEASEPPADETAESPAEETREPAAEETAEQPVEEASESPADEAPEPAAQEGTPSEGPEQVTAPLQLDVAAGEVVEESSIAAGPVAEDSSADGGDVGELRVTAIHLGGVANLPTGRAGLDLRMSEQGLDIMRANDEIVGRLPWSDIEALEVPSRRRRRRQNPAAAKLVVRTRQGDASFEIPGFSSEELRDRVELRLDRYRQL
jgi:hypothetical protein